MTGLRRILIAAVLGSTGPALADSYRAPALLEGRHTSIQAYGKQNPDCLEWTNGCVACARDGDRTACSTPGIACTPAGLTCKRSTSAKSR